MASRKCPFCKKGALRRLKKAVKFKYKGHTITVQQPGWYCNSCHEGIVEGSDIKATEKHLHDSRARVEGYLSSDEVRRIRTKLKLTQIQAAAIFGGGPNAFSRYERGEVRHNRALDQLLRLLDRYPEHLEELIKSEAA